MRVAKFSKLKAALAGIALLSAPLSLTGCTDPLESEQPFASGDVPKSAISEDCQARPGKERAAVTSETAVILAPTSTFVRFSNAIAVSDADLRAALNRQGATISTVLATGTPRSVFKRTTNFSEAVFEADRDKEVKAGIGKIRKTYYCAVMSKTQNSTVLNQGSGSDLLAAFNVAASTFTHDGVAHNIIVIGNGLPDVGQLNFSENFPKDSQTAIQWAQELAGNGGLPDLSSVTVSWFGLGQTDGVIQKALHPLASKALEAFWTELIKAAGGELVKVVKTIPYADPVSTSIQVKAIEVPAPPCVFMLTSDDGFNFKADSAEFLDSAKAIKGAETMAAEIARSNCSGPLYVVGYAASGVDKRDYNASAAAKVKSISASRAIAFKALLAKAGVAIKLVPVGAGKGPTNDWDVSGKFIEEMGKQNRFVEITQSKPEGN